MYNQYGGRSGSNNMGVMGLIGTQNNLFIYSGVYMFSGQASVF